MAENTGFLVRQDRFSLTDTGLYLVTGWLAPHAEVSASLDGKAVDVSFHKLTDNVDERYGGCETILELDLGENLKGRSLHLYADRGEGRRLFFSISVKDLREKQRPIRYFIDDAAVLRHDGLMRIQGWAVAKEPVRVDVYGTNGEKLLEHVERYRRYDTVELFPEFPVDPGSGFNIELRPIPKGPVRVRFRTKDDELVLSFPTNRSGVAAAKAGKYAEKAWKALRYQGPATLFSKTYNRLFNPAMRTVEYGQWIRKHLPTERELARQRKEPLHVHPLVSIVVPCYRTPEKYLRELVSSITDQTYPDWELVLSDGSGENSPIAAYLDEIASADKRIRVLHHDKKLRIAENTNAALHEAKGEWIAFSDHDDLLVPSALYDCMKVVNRYPDTQMIYTDEDKIGPGDHFMQPNLKPDFDPDFLHSVNYICHLLLVSRALYEETGDLDPAFDGAQDYDFILRCTEHTSAIRHVPQILYHWRFFEGSTSANPEAKTYAFEAGRRAIQAWYDRQGLPAMVENGEYPGLYRTHWHWKDEPLVSVLIPNKDHIDDLRTAIRSLLEKTTWKNLEILIIENNSEDPATFDGYRQLTDEDARIRVVTYKGGFNYSAINNFGVREAKGAYYLFLNNDTECVSDAVSEMMGYAMRPDVGAVGARLYYEDGTIQHAGVIVGWGGVAGHAFVNQKRGVTGYQHRIICQQDYSAVTAACMLMPAKVFKEVGGFTEELAVAFNDIDLCMKIREKGYLIVYNPFAELYHYESKSRGLENTPEKVSRFGQEVVYFKDHWPDILRDGDPYYNPNLSMVTQDFSLKQN